MNHNNGYRLKQPNKALHLLVASASGAGER